MFIESLLDLELPLVNEAWASIDECYKDTKNRDLPSAQITIKQIMAERVTLYQKVPPPPPWRRTPW